MALATRLRSASHWSDPRVKPPYGAVSVDRTHPLSQDLVIACLANEGAGQLHDVANDLALNPGHGALVMPVWGSSPGGLSHVATTTYFTTRPDFYNSTNGSMLIILNDKLNVTHFQLIGGIIDALVIDNKIWGVFADHGTIVNNGFDVVHSGGTVNLGSDTRRAGLHAYGISLTSGGNAVLYRDGALATTNTWVTPANGNANSVPTVRALPAATEIQTVASVVWNRALSNTELAWATTEPYAFLRPIIRRRYFFFTPAAAAAGNIFIQEHIGRGIGRGVLIGR